MCLQLFHFVDISPSSFIHVTCGTYFCGTLLHVGFICFNLCCIWDLFVLIHSFGDIILILDSESTCKWHCNEKSNGLSGC